MKWSRKKRALIIAGIALVLLPVAFVLVANAMVTGGARGFIKPQAELPACQVAIVLGAGVRPDGSLSAMLEDRVATGVELYPAGKVRKLLLSGDHGRMTYDEANAMRRRVLAAGLPPEDVFLDHAGFSTYETMYRARDVFQVTDAIVVTQGFHLARSVYTARRLGLDAWGCEADKRPYATATRSIVREWLARCKAVVELHLTRPRPHFLGPAIPIAGDGRASWDTPD
ncbi:MAG TPA: ElyC/SanA/YdcF family protein [Planctomycetota bacterium]|nr:ElyC/SanA/YdcF family protein [Planctomycetota bacterium]